MIINEVCMSGGDLLPWMFRRSALGPLVGKRTWGGLVGMYTILPDDLLDGGTAIPPNLAFYTPEGAWEVENEGVPPDIEVEYDPRAAREGRDTQLLKAIETALELLKRTPPPPPPQRPPYPDYYREPKTRRGERGSQT